MHRGVALAAWLLIVLSALSPPAGALEDPPPAQDPKCVGSVIIEVPQPDQSGIDCGYGKNETSGGSSGGSSSGVWPPPGWEPFLLMQSDQDGKPCVVTSYHPPGVAPEDVNQYDGGTRIPEGAFPTCPTGQGQQTSDPGTIAARYWEQIPLPKPQPYIAPGWAITGKLAYLETNGQTRYTYRNSTIVGPLVIEATGRYYVKWGDDEQSGPFSYEGKPWPEGQITHDYVWAKSYNIVVEERWTATWSLGGKSGTLRELQTTGRIDNFPARQIQAVVRVLPN